MSVSAQQAAVIQQMRAEGFVVVLVDPSETHRIDRACLASRLNADAADYIEEMLSLEAVDVRSAS